MGKGKLVGTYLNDSDLSGEFLNVVTPCIFTSEGSRDHTREAYILLEPDQGPRQGAVLPKSSIEEYFPAYMLVGTDAYDYTGIVFEGDDNTRKMGFIKAPYQAVKAALKPA